MMRSLLLRFVLLFGLTVGVGVARSSAAPSVKEYPLENVALTVPDGWIDQTVEYQQLGKIAAFRDRTGTKVVILVKDTKNVPPREIDGQIVDEIEAGMQSTGAGERTSWRFVEIQGVKSYERTGDMSAKGKKVSMLVQIIPVRDRLFYLQALRFDGGKAETDPEVRSFFSSFRFLKPPEVAPKAPSTAYRMGYTFAIVVILLGVAFVIWRVLFAGRREEE